MPSTSMPAEHLTGIVGSIVGAVLIILQWAVGTEVPTEVAAAVVVLVSWLATAVTWWVRRREGGPRVPATEYPEDEPSA